MQWNRYKISDLTTQFNRNPTTHNFVRYLSQNTMAKMVNETAHRILKV
jgi:hypothetical protein